MLKSLCLINIKANLNASCLRVVHVPESKHLLIAHLKLHFVVGVNIWHLTHSLKRWWIKFTESNKTHRQHTLATVFRGLSIRMCQWKFKGWPNKAHGNHKCDALGCRYFARFMNNNDALNPFAKTTYNNFSVAKLPSLGKDTQCLSSTENGSFYVFFCKYYGPKK